MPKCSAMRADGSTCQGDAIPPATVCWAHDPAHAAARQRHARQGGKAGGQGRPAPVTTELDEIRTLLKGLTAAALNEKYERGVIAVVNQVLQTRLKVIELERKIKETDELEARIALLEGNHDAS